MIPSHIGEEKRKWSSTDRFRFIVILALSIFGLFFFYSIWALLTAHTADNFLGKLSYAVVDGHDDAFYHWLNSIEEGKIPVNKKLTIIHIDSHPDMGYPESLTSDMFHDRKPWQKLKTPFNNIQIASFQIPMIYAGYVERVIWVRPSWSHQIPDGKEEINVGNIEKSKKVSSDSRAPYFGHAYGEVPKLENVKKFTLEVINLKQEKEKGVDLSSLNIDPDRTLLDIDLDYFSTSNPQRIQMKEEYGLDEEAIARLGKVFSMQSYDFTRIAVPREVEKKLVPARSQDPKIIEFSKQEQLYYHVCAKYFIQEKFLHMRDEYYVRKLRFCRRSFIGSRSEIKKMVLEVKKFMLQQLLTINIHTKRSEKGKAKAELIHFMNLVLNLPNHISSQLEIVHMREELEKFFYEVGLSKDNHHPIMTTIARSESDGHTPRDLREFIEKQVYIMLHNAFVRRVSNDKRVNFFDAY